MISVCARTEESEEDWKVDISPPISRLRSGWWLQGRIRSISDGPSNSSRQASARPRRPVCTSADNSPHLLSSPSLSLAPSPLTEGEKTNIKAYFIQRDTKYLRCMYYQPFKNLTRKIWHQDIIRLCMSLWQCDMWHFIFVTSSWNANYLMIFFLLKFPQHICLSQPLTGLKPITIMTDMRKNFLSHANFLNFSCQHLLNDRQWNWKTWKEKFVTVWRVTFKSDHIH